MTLLELAGPLPTRKKHLYLEALALPADYQINHLWLHYIKHNHFYENDEMHCMALEHRDHNQTGSAQLPRTTRAPQRPTGKEGLSHGFALQPCLAGATY